MRALSLFRIIFLAACVVAWHLPAQAQTGPTPQQFQAMIANGQAKTALGDLKTILQAHPHSGVAWYLVAEAQDASGNRAAARGALAKAEQYAPGLPFAQPGKVAALKAHLAEPAGRSGFGVSPVVIVIAVLVLLFVLVRLFLRSRRVLPPGYQTGRGGFPGGPPAGPFPYGSGVGMPYGPGVGTPGSGVGSSIVSGLAAGAGFAAGERAIEGLMGGSRGERGIDTGSGNDPASVPDRDDGLTGSPGWGDDNSGPGDSDTLSSGGGFDPDNNW